MKGLTYTPESVGEVEVAWWRAHHIKDKEALLSGLVQHHVEMYGLSKEDAQRVVKFMMAAAAVKDHDTHDWNAAIEKMVEAYTIVRDVLGLGFDPAEVAKLEVGWWKLHDELEFIKDKTPLAQNFAKLFATIFSVSEESLTEAGRLKAEATRQHDLAEAEGVPDAVAEDHWQKAEETLVAFYTELQTVVNG